VPLGVERSMTAPADYTCPITLEVMRDPVLLHSEAGRSYERSALEEHLRRDPFLDPSTGERSSQPLQFTRNQILKNIIEAWNVTNCVANEARLLAAQDAETRKRAATALAVRLPPAGFFF